MDYPMDSNQAHAWDGSRLSDRDFAFRVFGSTATSPIFGAAHGDKGACVVQPNQLGPFLRVHADLPIICDDISSWFWPFHHYLNNVPDPRAVEDLWGYAESCRIRDLPILDQLIRLASAGTHLLHPVSLSVLPLDTLNLTMLTMYYPDVRDAATAERDDNRRSEAVANSSLKERHTDANAIKYVQTLANTYRTMMGRITDLVGDQVCESSWAKFGPLGVGLQAQGKIALASIERDALHLASEATRRVRAKRENLLMMAEKELRTDREAWRCLKTRNKSILLGDDGPKVKGQAFQTWLQSVLDSVVGLHRTPFGSLFRHCDALSTEEWGTLARCHPLLRCWNDLRNASVMGRLLSSKESSVPCRYGILPRIRPTPDLTAIWSLGGGAAFQPTPGNIFLPIQLCDLALRSLAAVCERRYGESVLGTLFRAGKDPHEHAASSFAAPSRSPSAAARSRDEWLKVSQMLLVSAPMALGGESIRTLARLDFDLELGLTEVMELHGRLVNEIFPELGKFIHDDTLDIMAANLNTTAEKIRDCLKSVFERVPEVPRLRQWFQGIDAPSSRISRKIWNLLKNLNASPKLDRLVKKEEFGIELYMALFGRTVTTLTGRMRSRSPFGIAHRAEYLDLADDAAKAALFAVCRTGLKVAAFLDETIVIECPADLTVQSTAQQVFDLANGAIERVLHGVPGKCACRFDTWNG